MNHKSMKDSEYAEEQGSSDPIDETEGDGGVPVVSAGMHRPVGLRPVLDLILLVDGEGIDIGAHGQHGSRATGAEACHHAGCGGARDLEVADLLKHLLDEPGGFVFVKGHFRALVQRAAPRDNLRRELVSL